MAGEIKVIADYLTYKEGFLVGQKLSEAEIPFWVRTCGPPAIPFGQGIYYRLLVNAENADSATIISDSFLKEIRSEINILKCPKCKSEAVFRPETLPFWQRIYYAGTQVYQCESCENRFSN